MFANENDVCPLPAAEAEAEGDFVDAEPALEAELAIVRATKVAEFGPAFRDRQIFYAVASGEPAEQVARRWQLAVRTVRNIAAVVRDRLARELAVWRRMTLAELEAEEERLARLATAAQNGWNAPVTRTRRRETARGGSEQTTTRPGRGELRLLAAVQRMGPALDELGRYIELRMAQEERAAELRAPAESQQPPRSSAARVERTERRKSLSGRRLRLPRFVRALSARRSAGDVFRIIRSLAASKTWVRGVGIPPPAAASRLHPH